MKLVEAQLLAEDLIAKYIPRYQFCFNKRLKRTLGRCRFTKKTIELSQSYVELNDIEMVKNTILHEIAHALTGVGHGHDAIWRKNCRLIGAIPKPYNSEAKIMFHYRAICPECGEEHYSLHNPDKYYSWCNCIKHCSEKNRLHYVKGQYIR